ncbi:spore coat U domain-containing protein [Azotobacter armeniacus]
MHMFRNSGMSGRQNFRWGRHLLLLAFATCCPVVAFSACNVQAQSVAYGNYDVFDTAPLDGVGNVQVSCEDGLFSYTISLSSGSGSYSERQMTSAGHVLVYNLYSDASRNSIWGDGSGGTSQVGGSTSGTVDHTIYGRIPAQQNASVGIYTDSIIVTLDF